MKSVATLCMLSTAFALFACGGTDEPTPLAADTTERALFDCNAPDQRLTCALSTHPNKRFICHGTGMASMPYAKLEVPVNSAHTPGVAHGPFARPDQNPGASAVDVGAGVGLDCDCHERVCQGVCTGGETGAECDDGDRCTGNGTCSGNDCTPGAPSCTPGQPIDSCNVESGACDGDTGACLIEPLPAGTSCENGNVCNASGACVECLDASMCPAGFVCDAAGSCAGAPRVLLNEIESSGGTPGDWVELYNSGTASADVSGWRFLDNDNSHTAYVIPAGTTIAVGGYLVLEEANFVFGLGAADSARLFDSTGTTVDSYNWTAHAATTYGRCPNGTGAFRTTNASTKGTANDCSIAVRINEVESSGGSPGDWTELFNAGAIPINLSGWIFRDNDDTHAYAIPAGTTIASGAYYLLDEAAFGFGLGAADSARIYDATGALIDTYSWTAHATTTYGRCPNGSGPFATTAASTRGAANDCGPTGPPPLPAWPGANAVHTVDGVNVFGTNLSDLFYEPATGTTPDILWAVRNSPSMLFRLEWNGTIWTPQTSNDWSAGKTLRYTDGTGSPDAEGVTRDELLSSAIYVATERDNNISNVSRLSVLRFDTNDVGTELVATHEWNLNGDLPVVGSNLGLEAISWLPDSFLVANAFFDESAGHTYNPSEYPSHGTGLFFVGVEANGTIYAYALDHDGGDFRRIATIASGNPGVMGLDFDRDVGYLWAQCDDTCGNVAGALAVDTSLSSPTFGRFRLLRQFARPTSMANLNNEGIAIAPESSCTGGFKQFLWTDDSQTDGHALRADTIPCGRFIP